MTQDDESSTRDPKTGIIHGFWFCKCGAWTRSPMQLQTHIWNRHDGEEPANAAQGLALARLGLPNYRAYLQGDHWQRLRARHLTEYGSKCHNCGAQPVELHHLTYERLGNESMSDLVALCDECHEGAHGV